MNRSPGTVQVERKLPVGAEIIHGKGVHFRLWAPKCSRVDVTGEERLGENRYNPISSFEMTSEDDGYFSALVPDFAEGSCYRFRLDGRKDLHPDPASRFQPDGPHGTSQVIDPSKYNWQDSGWKGVRPENAVIYEMHIGTYTQEGTYRSAAAKIAGLAELGITVFEIMPVSEFPGTFGWGYDGVDIYAPTRLYGHPDDLRYFVDTAHSHGIAVILDVVYNHLGPDGNYLREFSPWYFTQKYDNEWGDAINFDGKNSHGVRDYFASNASYWIDEFHMDGLRLDATQQIYDSSAEHILKVITHNAREAARERCVFIVAENEPQYTRLIRPPAEGGYGIDALWNDDFHHSLHVALTGHNEAYYTDYNGAPQEFISALKYGFLYQGQRYKWQKQRRGTPALDIQPVSFINYFENHDQVANSARGLRMHFLTSPGLYRAAAALLLLTPSIPMLFQGQEFASSRPFLYFADHSPELARLVKEGRCKFLAQFPSIATEETQRMLADPSGRATFMSCKLDHTEKEKNSAVYSLYRDLIALRRDDPVLRSARTRNSFDGAVLGGEAFLIRFFGGDCNDRLLIVNFGADLHLSPSPEPLLAPPGDRKWKLLWSSESVKYGGGGMPEPDDEKSGWFISAHSAMLLAGHSINSIKC
ncbi:MAG: malto-oligosyltrehalose trehalohydrolase [Bacteroidota bacterium]